MAKYDLQRFRRERGMTQIQLAKAIGVSQGFLSGMETGRNPFPEERLKLFAESFPEVNLEDYALPEKEPVKVTVTEYMDSEAAAEGVRKKVVEIKEEFAERKREIAEYEEKKAHRRSPEFQKYLDYVTIRFKSEYPDFDDPNMRAELASVLEEIEELNKWNDELRAKNDSLRNLLDGTRDSLFKTQQEVVRLQQILIKNKIDF